MGGQIICVKQEPGCVAHARNTNLLGREASVLLQTALVCRTGYCHARLPYGDGPDH
ncbi:hypothetical protein ACI01nite_11320 [Acetobacter cibinongensis]|uniref:Uncharacterized protein n=1 Tax=Acetobacter cibinongensis TaxID=146475 RepID=A0A0D6N5X4_9PROT|nr:hypothetical protein Abci_017_157 [Acetobacter cibinongensis]GBQ13089.1 hypothetical protein AA0482_0475 [Acetobacter cibinongensis NRIC 0482]GEL58530.1 hypothetical protein ACI01nite_11320 [Acetobacter cibinongensis]